MKRKSIRTFISTIVTFLVVCIGVFFTSTSQVRAVEGEITHTGTNTSLIGDDNSAGPFNLGFTFNYYGIDS